MTNKLNLFNKLLVIEVKQCGVQQVGSVRRADAAVNSINDLENLINVSNSFCLNIVCRVVVSL